MKRCIALASSLALVVVFIGCKSSNAASTAAGRHISKAARPLALVPPKPADPYFEPFMLKPAPQPTGLLLKRGDRLAICGDSITEQKMYSRMMETYLAACVPQFDVSVRQYGWGGERADGFWRRMTNDVLRFEPTIATTCYGMNDHLYRPYEESIGRTYRSNTLGIVNAFQDNGVRVVLGSPGCLTVAERSRWKEPAALAQNLNLCELRNIGVETAMQEGTAFADVFWPMLVATHEGKQRYGADFTLPGDDGFHPGWSGSAVMAYAFLRAMGLDGEIGTYTVDLKSGKARASAGHEVLAAKDGEVRIRSTRYPFCATGETNKDNTIRAAMTLVPFNQELNRLMLVVKNPEAKRYKVTWGNQSRSYSAAELGKGVNLAADFAENPFVPAFKKVDEAVAAKQAYETKQIKAIFHDLVNGKFKTAEEIKDPEVKRLFALRKPDGKFDRDQIATETEKTRAPLVAAVKSALVPVEHTISLQPE